MRPGAQRLPRRVAFAAIQHVVLQLVVVLVVGPPLQRLQPLLIGAAAERRAAGRLVLRGLRQLAFRRRLILEAREIRIAGRVRLLEDDARRMDGDRADLRSQVSLQVRGGDRRQRRDRRRVPVKHRAPLQVARLRTRDRRARQPW